MNIAHISVVCRSVENAARFYGDLLRFTKVKDFSIEAELTENIFGIPCRCQIIVYQGEEDEVEVFIPEAFPKEKCPFDHVCLEVRDKGSFLEECKNADVRINRIAKGDKFLTFIKDFDGNLFEIKERAQA